MTLRIAELADRAGISTAAVRYYERIGVLPEPARATNGYRTYDDRAVARLELVNRAKALGCTLEETGDLVRAWEGDECGPVQDRLRELVVAKQAAAQAAIAELELLVAQLRDAEESLGRHRPPGPCDLDCGCLADAPAGPTAVRLGRVPAVTG